MERTNKGFKQEQEKKRKKNPTIYFNETNLDIFVSSFKHQK